MTRPENDDEHQEIVLEYPQNNRQHILADGWKKAGRDHGLSVGEDRRLVFRALKTLFLLWEEVNRWMLEKHLDFRVTDDFSGRLGNTSSIVIRCSKKALESP